jgi:hypothetical protein
MRLSEAHAKLMFRRSVLVEDAVVAISCVALSQEHSHSSLLGKGSTWFLLAVVTYQVLGCRSNRCFGES